MALAQSFGYAPQYGIQLFPTLNYYQTLFSDTAFWGSLGLTFYYALVPTLIGVGLSIGFALYLARTFRSNSIALLFYQIPMVLPYLVGVSLAILLFSNGGLFARLLYQIGAIGSPSDFPRLINTSNGVGIMIVYLWKQVPFMTLILYSNLLVLGNREEEGAYLLGADRWQVFQHITLPKLVPSLVSASLIVFAFNFGSFEVPYLLGAGFPNTLPVEAWRYFDSPDLNDRPKAMAIVVLVSLISASCLYVALYAYRRYEVSRGRK
nr:ABC transporter permease subunit [Sneathiella limimaris]